jgi:hypothetical protein
LKDKINGDLKHHNHERLNPLKNKNNNYLGYKFNEEISKPMKNSLRKH